MGLRRNTPTQLPLQYPQGLGADAATPTTYSLTNLIIASAGTLFVGLGIGLMLPRKSK